MWFTLCYCALVYISHWMPGFCLLFQISRTLSLQHILALVAFCPVSRAENQIRNLALCQCALGRVTSKIVPVWQWKSKLA